MSPELDAALVRDFPELYADRHGDMRTTAMCWGFECRDGWEPLIRKLSEQLTFLAKVEGAPVRASQVKEKYGTLRFYTDSETEIMRACIAYAEDLSAQTCEDCGKYARTRSKGWVATLCAPCAYKQGYPLASWEAEKLGVTDHVQEGTEP
jgi:hypothetical protein